MLLDYYHPRARRVSRVMLSGGAEGTVKALLSLLQGLLEIVLYMFDAY